MSRQWAARQAFETMDRSLLLRRALLARARPTGRTMDCFTAISRTRLAHETQQRPQDCSGNTPLVTNSLSLCDGRTKTFSCRDRVTKVAHECSRKASVVEQISWDVTVEEMWLFAKAFNYDEAVLEEPLTDNQSHAHFDGVEMHKVPKWRAKSRGSR